MDSLSTDQHRGSVVIPRTATGTYRRPGFLRRYGQPYLFMLPAALLVALVSPYPIIYSGFLSLFQTRFLTRVRFVGLDNYSKLLTDEAVWRNFYLSLTYVIGTLVVVVPFGFGVALLLNQPVRFRSAFRAAIILPWAVSQTIVALLWGWILNPDFGPGTYILEQLGFGKLTLLSDPILAMVVLIGVNAWSSYPLATTLFLSAIQTIPAELIDATQVDGASDWQRLRHVTLPLIRPTMLIIVILLSLHSFNMVTLVLILTGGGPLASTELLSLRTFNEAFQFWHLGFSSALGICIFLVNVVFSLIYIRLLRRESVT